ncbi:hypothetical protein NP233_g11849 [Leucocoprinus birnbaumii]|uniref:Uncharacterized protein n=1 Tax=Leucocoprinus birnbaumii TaxID=56174 RepID=A0AAD5VG72_9AGAR|nr:hypothetical protein NP233_g11849 [Leucocoprinus birnbaumii]
MLPANLGCSSDHLPPKEGQQRPPAAQGQQRPQIAQGMQICRPPTVQGMQGPPTAQGHHVISGAGPGSTPQTPNLPHCRWPCNFTLLPLRINNKVGQVHSSSLDRLPLRAQQAQQAQASLPFGANFPAGTGDGMQGRPPPMSGSMPGSLHHGAQRKINLPHIGGTAPMNMNTTGHPNRMSGPSGGGPGNLCRSNDMMGGLNLNVLNLDMGTLQTPVRQGSISGMAGGGTPMNQAQTLAQQHQLHQLQQQLRQQQLRRQCEQQVQAVQQARQNLIQPGVLLMRASVPLAAPGLNVTRPVPRTPSTVSGTPAPAGTGPLLKAGGPSTSNEQRLSASTSTRPVIASGLPPLFTNVQLNPATAVPPIDLLKLIPAIPEEEIHEIQRLMKTDKGYEGVLRKMKERMTDKMRGLLGGTNGCWWEKDSTSVGVLRWKRPREGFDAKEIGVEEVDRPEQLVPIQLEFDVEHYKMRDTFVLNLNDLGELVVDDLKNEVPILQRSQDVGEGKWWESWSWKNDELSGVVVRGVSGSLRRSKKKRKLNLNNSSNGSTTHSEVVKVEEEEKSVVGSAAAAAAVGVTFDVPMDVEEFGRPMVIDEIKLDEELIHEEMRSLIKNDSDSPEEFSEVYAQDLGLGGEFNIWGQVQMYQKLVFLIDHPSHCTPIQDEVLWAYQWSPSRED